jgi:chromosome segregation ATPase
VNSVSLGLRELARLLDRLTCRLRLLSQRRQLGRFESHLGLLGWQQADYDSGTQRHVDRLADCERSQAQLTNESATLGLTLQQLEERRTLERTTFERQQAERKATREPFVGTVEEGDKALAAKERERRELEERIAILNRELGNAEEKYRVLLAQGAHDTSGEAEVQRWQRLVISIPREKLEWEGKLSVLMESLQRLEIDVRQRRAQLSVETTALQTLEKAFEESDMALTREIAVRKREKQNLERQIDDLEKAKTHPYREIGKVLADQRIEPVNQPEALVAVLTQREKIAAQQAKLTASLEKSRRENRLQVWSSWLLLLTIGVMVFGSIWVIIVRTR